MSRARVRKLEKKLMSCEIVQTDIWFSYVNPETKEVTMSKKDGFVTYTEEEFNEIIYERRMRGIRTVIFTDNNWENFVSLSKW